MTAGRKSTLTSLYQSYLSRLQTMKKIEKFWNAVAEMECVQQFFFVIFKTVFSFNGTRIFHLACFSPTRRRRKWKSLQRERVAATVPMRGLHSTVNSRSRVSSLFMPEYIKTFIIFWLSRSRRTLINLHIFTICNLFFFFSFLALCINIITYVRTVWTRRAYEYTILGAHVIDLLLRVSNTTTPIASSRATRCA